jgi:hypothetical protein
MLSVMDFSGQRDTLPPAQEREGMEMPKWLMALVAAACLVVCAAGANYVWLAWLEKQQAAEHRTAVFEFLKVDPGDNEAAAKVCKEVKAHMEDAPTLKWNDDTIAYARKMVDLCETNGFL